jgi:hypothetical protein
MEGTGPRHHATYAIFPDNSGYSERRGGQTQLPSITEDYRGELALTVPKFEPKFRSLDHIL